jgi:hypothetical protein
VSPAVDPAVHLALRAAFVLLLGTAATHKLRAPGAFRRIVADYALAPASLTGAAAGAVVIAEVGVTAALVVRPAAGAIAAAGLLAGYAAAIAGNLARGRRAIDCGCSGPARRQTLSGWLVFRNLLLATGALVVALPVAGRPFVWVDAVTVAGATTVAAAAYLALDRLLALAPAARRIRGTA